MKTLLFFATVMLALGCQLSPKNSDSASCASSRDPAAAGLTCAEVFSNSQTTSGFKLLTEEDFAAFFREIEVQRHMRETDAYYKIQDSYTLSSTLLNARIGKTSQGGPEDPLREVSQGQVLLERSLLNESTAKFYKEELGFTDYRGYLIPPKDLPKLYAKLALRLFESARKNGVADEDIWQFAFLFKGYNSVKEKWDILFIPTTAQSVPPHLPYTSPDRFQLWHEQLNLPDFYRMILEGKFILEPGTFAHDIGHYMDAIERPQYMPAYSHFVKMKTTMLSKYPTEKLPAVVGQVAFRGDLERYFNEWLYLPSKNNLNKIKKLVPSLETSKLVGLSSVQTLYKGKSDAELLATAKSFLKNRYTLFASHGGGARDWTAEQYITPQDLVNGYKEIMSKKGGAVTPDQLDNKEPQYAQRQDHAYWMHEPIGLFLRLDQLVQLIEGKPVSEHILNGVLDLAEKAGYKNPQTFIYQLISLHLAEVQYKLQTALFYDMTPEQIALDTSLLYQDKGWEQYKQSKTYNYYSTYRKYTLQWFLGHDIARPASNRGR